MRRKKKGTNKQTNQLINAFINGIGAKILKVVHDILVEEAKLEFSLCTITSDLSQVGTI